MRNLSGWFVLLLTMAFSSVACLALPPADSRPSPSPIPFGAQFDAEGHLDVVQATRAYLELVPPDKRAASDLYFEGGYWLTLWDALATIAISLILLFTALSARLRNWAERVTRLRWIQDWLFYIGFTLASTVLGAPLLWYESFHREHTYSQSHQAFGGWLHDQLIVLALTLLLGGLLVAALYAVIRRFPGTWHLWGTAVAVLFLILLTVITPVYLAPLLNTYSTIQDASVTGPVLRMAHANGIEVDKLFQVDASRQTTRVSANVSGLFGTTRITLNDNLLHTASLPEIEAVTGHEMGHYVLNHIAKGVPPFAIEAFFFFVLLRAWLGSMQRRWGLRWGTHGIEDIALLPAAVLAITVLAFLATPINNTLTRTREYEADIFGLNASRQPDGFAQAMLKLAQYRKLEPTALEEVLFYDHPSGRTRIRAAMRWKSENSTIVACCAGYAATPKQTPSLAQPPLRAPIFKRRTLPSSTH